MKPDVVGKPSEYDSSGSSKDFGDPDIIARRMDVRESTPQSGEFPEKGYKVIESNLRSQTFKPVGEPAPAVRRWKPKGA